MSFDQPLPAALSPSRLADFQACPRRYQQASIERIPQPASYATAKGRLAHRVFEVLFAVDGPERTLERARDALPDALEEIITADVREEAGLDDESVARMVEEVATIIGRYFELEDPTTVASEGVELRLSASLNGAPVAGILDRLDRNPDGTLTIVDYKTGRLPNRDYDSQTFANTELYAALCEAALETRPKNIRLLYVAHGRAIERPVSDVVTQARAHAAAAAWERITRYYRAGEFPAKPSARTCRFCSFQDRCRAAGVPVPLR